MAEIEVLKASSGRIPTEDLHSPEISPETEKRLRLFDRAKNFFRFLQERTLKTGDLLAEYRKEALRAASLMLLTASAAACSGAQSEAPDVAVRTQTVPPTPRPEQTMDTIPSTQPPIIDSRTKEPALTPVETKTPAVEATPTTTPEPSPTPTPRTPEKPIETSLFQEIKQKIDQSLGTEAKKAQAHETLNQFEKVQQRTDEFKNYEAERQTQGEGNLLQLIQQKFNRLGDTFPEFKIEDQIFYLKDENDLRTVLNQLKEKSPDELLTSISESQKQFFDEGKPAGKRRYAYITPELAQSPTTEFDLSKTTSPLAPKAAEEFRAFLKEIGLEGQIRLKIILADELSMGNATGTFSASGPLPEIEIAPPFDKSTLVAEIAHLIDPDSNSFLYSQLSPEEIINLHILKLKLLNNPEWGRNYPQLELIFRQEAATSFTKQLARKPLTTKELVSAFIQPEDWLYTSSVDRFKPPKTPFFDPFQVLDKKFNQTFDQEFQDRLRLENKYITGEDFTKAEWQILDQIASSAQSSQWDRLFVELFKEQAPKITNLFLLDEISIAHLRRIFFISSAFAGDERVADLFAKMPPPKERNQILEAVLGYYRDTDDELLSDMIEAAITHRLNGQELKLENPSQNPYEEYLHFAIRLLPR